ncbi:unnamed protein product, partial [marine sediment metagenome]
SPVLIEGRLKLDTWETDGQKRSKLKVIGERMQMLGRASGSGGGSPGGKPPSHDASEYSQPAGDEQVPPTGGSPDGPPGDDIPF